MARNQEESNGLRILTTPSEYYDYIKTQCEQASDTIILSALYFGCGKLENDLIDTLANALSIKPKLKLTFILDYHRSHREIRSMPILAKLTGSFKEQCRILFYKMPRTYPFFSNQTNEIMGVFHCKYCVFDGNATLSGANMNEEYFTTRQDRYHIFSDNFVGMTSFLKEFSEIIAPFCHELRLDTTLTPPVVTSKAVLKQSLNRFAGNSVLFDSSSSTMLVPLVQHHSIRSKLESQLIPSLFKHVQQILQSHGNIALANIFLTTPYPSFTKKFMRPLSQLLRQRDESVIPVTLQDSSCSSDEGVDNIKSILPDEVSNSVQIIIPSQSAHGFHKGTVGTYKSFIPLFHSCAFEQAMDLLPHQRYHQRLEYCKPNWTYHAKGLWMFFKHHSPVSAGKVQKDQNSTVEASSISNFPVSSADEQVTRQIWRNVKAVTYIGSSNLGERSWTRDFELGFILVTKDNEIARKLEREVFGLVTASKLLDNSRIMTHAETKVKYSPFQRALRTKPSIQFFTRLLRTFL